MLTLAAAALGDIKLLNMGHSSTSRYIFLRLDVVLAVLTTAFHCPDEGLGSMA